MNVKLRFEEIASLKLAKLCPLPLYLVWHENRASYFSCRKECSSVHLRLHRLFVKAPSPVLEAVVGFAMKGDKKAGTIVRQMANLYFFQERASAEPLKTKGNVYDLHQIRDKVKKQYFPNLEVAIGWSIRGRIGNFRCMTFGSYDRYRNQIRINPLLDDPLVPCYFLEFIVYHEMLHAVCLPRFDVRGAVHSHTPEFRFLESQFSEFKAAKEWEKQSLKFFKRFNGRA